MWNAIDDIRVEAEAAGEAKGKAEEYIKTKSADIRSVKESFHVSTERAMDILKVTKEEERRMFKKLLD